MRGGDDIEHALVEERADGKIGMQRESPERITESYGMMQFIQTREARQGGSGMESDRERGKTASHSQARFARFARYPQGADLLVQIENRRAFERARMSCATKHGIHQQRLGEGIFEIPAERSRTALNARLDVFVKYQRL